MILNSQQIEQLVSIFGIQKSEHTILPKLSLDLADTLAAYADVVQKVAEMEDIVLMADGARLVGNCMFCGGVIGLEEEHEEDCPYLKARKLREVE